MTGDVLVPVLITFLIVNVVLLVRTWAAGRLGRPRVAAAGGPPYVPLADRPPGPDPTDEAVAVAPAARAPTNEAVAAAPAAPAPTDLAVAAAPAAPDSAEVEPAPVPGGRDLPFGMDDEATWDRRVADENARVVRYRRPVTIVRLELDGLDGLIGLLGDQAGDRLVLAMADTLRRLARDTDHIARLGSGGFGVLMLETPEEAAVGFVERVSRACDLWLESSAVAVRLTIGWASTSGGVGLADVQRLATVRMHRGSWRQARRAATLAYPGPAPRDAARPAVSKVASAVTPRLSWETGRDPAGQHRAQP